MASASDRVYFPPLEDCLGGNTILLSWKLISVALSDPSSERLLGNDVSQFLKDKYILGLFKNPGDVFAVANSESKASFETKTAAINVTPTPNEKYDIKTIKDDALWLSRVAGISEVTALRVVVVEFQTRAQNHLTGALSTQDVVNLQEAAGANNAQATTVLPPINMSMVVDAETLWADFEKEETRRQRLYATYLSERRHCLMASDCLLSLLIYGPGKSPSSGEAATELRRDILREAFGFNSVADFNVKAFEPLLDNYFNLIPSYIESSGAGIAAVAKDSLLQTEEFEVDWLRTCLVEAIHAMTVMFQILDISSSVFAPPQMVKQWFNFVTTYEFLDQLQVVHEVISALVVPIKSLVCVISMKLINIGRALGKLHGEVELERNEVAYIEDTEVLNSVHQAILAAGNAELLTAYPVTLAWTLILHVMYVSFQARSERRDLLQNQKAQTSFELERQPGTGRRLSGGSIVSIEQSAYDQFLQNESMERDIQVVENLAMAVTSKGLVYDLMNEMALCMGVSKNATFRPVVGSKMRLTFLELLKASFSIIGYISDPVTTFLLVLSGGQGYWDINESHQVRPEHDVVTLALGDDAVLGSYVFQALNRYPCEHGPFIGMCTALSTSACVDERSDIVLSLLQRTPTLTFDLPDQFEGYELVSEDENSNSIRTLVDLPLFAANAARRRRTAEEEPFCIPAGTYGRFVQDSGHTVQVLYEHSTLSLMGKRLEANLAPESYYLRLGYLAAEEVAGTIALLATLVRTELLKASERGSQDPNEAGIAILNETSRLLPNGKDIVAVVCDFLDVNLQEEIASSDGGQIAVLNSCLQFLHAILPISPSNVWSYVAKSQLLNSESRGGRLSKITGSLDLDQERFGFLASSIKLLSSLVESAVTGAVQRRMGNKFRGRHNGPDNGTSAKVISLVSLSIAQTAVDLFESSSTWRFQSELQRTSILRDLVPLMNAIVRHAFVMGAPGSSGNLNASLEPAATYIIESFLSPSAGSLRFQPLFATLLIAFQMPESTLYSIQLQVLDERLCSVLEFATTLLRAADYLDLPSALIETHLFKGTPLLARLCAVSDSFRRKALALLEALVKSAGRATAEPPSLLGFLGPHLSRSFFQILSRMDRPFNRPAEAISIWNFFSTIIRSRQQWMANCILTGKTPREALRTDAKLAKASTDSVFNIATDKLQSISSISSQEALAILNFLTSAQNYWPWTVFEMQRNRPLTDTLRDFVTKLQPSAVTARENPMKAIYEARIAAYISEAFAMQLYHMRHVGADSDFPKLLASNLDYYLREGATVPGYNASLHSNFARNFANRYPGCSLDHFKRTLLEPEAFGDSYFYAKNYASSMLGFDSAWGGTRDNGFKYEMTMANYNLSLVDAQIALFHSWESLLLELSRALPGDQRVTKQMLQVAEQCLSANLESQGPEQIFQRITHSRASLALILVQRLVTNSLDTKDISSLLPVLWRALHGAANPFDPEEIEYYRILLKTLYVTLRAYSRPKDAAADGSQKPRRPSVEAIQTILNILDYVVARGFRNIVRMVHDPDMNVSPGDVALLTALLQVILAVPGMSENQAQVQNIMAEHDAMHVATSLFSWADKLADNGDPVYGELSLLFLLELSTLPAIAEQLACDGVLSQLTSANITAHIRRPNVSPFADHVGAQRCYGIWVKGMLPLLLNILTALGATIAPEVTYVLNQFSSLLASSTERFEAPGVSRTVSTQDKSQFMTLLAVSEVQTLALLTRVLAAFRAVNNRNIPEVAWDAQGVLENVEFWLATRKVLRERLLPLGPREVEWRNAKLQGAYDNVLEEKVVLQLESVRDVLSEDLDGEGFGIPTFGRDV